MTDSQVEAQVENNAEGVQKLTDTKAIIAYLVEKFPLCFIAEGEAKPLKIGLFQDLAEALKDDERVSKTQLRQALRQYTGAIYMAVAKVLSVWIYTATLLVY